MSLWIQVTWAPQCQLACFSGRGAPLVFLTHGGFVVCKRPIVVSIFYLRPPSLTFCVFFFPSSGICSLLLCFMPIISFLVSMALKGFSNSCYLYFTSWIWELSVLADDLRALRLKHNILESAVQEIPGCRVATVDSDEMASYIALFPLMFSKGIRLLFYYPNWLLVCQQHYLPSGTQLRF